MQTIDTGRAVLGIVISVAFVVGGLLLEGGNLLSVVSPSGLLIVGAGCVASGVMGFRERASGFSSLARAAVAAGVVGLIFGLVHVMENLDKPASIGPGISVAFVAPLYGCLLWALFRAVHHAHNSHRTPRDVETLEETALALAGIMALLFLTFAVLFALQMP